MQSNKVNVFHEHVLVKEIGSKKRTPLHQDQSYYCVNGKDNCSFWIPLDEVSKNSSPEFVIGSNKWNKQFLPTKFFGHSYDNKDDGFQKSKILNKALLNCTSDYVLFTDGDCIARADFLETHIYHRAPGFILSGGYFKLPMNISQDISKAYGSVARHIGIEIAWRRLGLLEDHIQLLLDMDRDNETVVVTAFGLTDGMLGVTEGVFEYERGLCQGASESPAVWVALYDGLLELESKHAGSDCILFETQD